MARPKKNPTQPPSSNEMPVTHPQVELPIATQRSILEELLAHTRTRRLKLQGKAFKDNDDKLKLLALDVTIGQLLLEIEDLP